MPGRGGPSFTTFLLVFIFIILPFLGVLLIITGYLTMQSLVDFWRTWLPVEVPLIMLFAIFGTILAVGKLLSMGSGRRG